MELGREDGKACSVERPSVFCVSHCRKVWLVLDSRYLMTWPDVQQFTCGSVRTDPDEVPCNLVADRCVSLVCFTVHLYIKLFYAGR